MIPTCSCVTQVTVDPTTCCPTLTCGPIDPVTGNCL
jgi:hypothetical protein